MKKNRLFYCGGYTLAEVLTVIVIIAVMATIAIPRFAGQRDKIAAAEAIGIMTIIHRAVLQYYDENRYYPAAQESDAAVKKTFGVDYQKPRNNWVFSTSKYGDVRAHNNSNDGNLDLLVGGTWTGTGAYYPKNDVAVWGSLWPGLQTGNGCFNCDNEG